MTEEAAFRADIATRMGQLMLANVELSTRAATQARQLAEMARERDKIKAELTEAREEIDRLSPKPPPEKVVSLKHGETGKSP